MKRFILGLIVGMLITGAGMVLAAQNIRLIINNQEVIADIPPQVINGHILIPARAVAEAFGATVSYNKAKNVIVITGGNNNNSDYGDDNSQNNNSESGKVYLFTDLKPFNIDSFETEQVSIAGQKVEAYCISSISSAREVYFRLGGKYKKLVVYTGAVDGHTYGGQLSFETTGGKTIKQIGGVPPKDGLKKFEINVTGVDVIRVSSYSNQWTNPSYIANAYVE